MNYHVARNEVALGQMSEEDITSRMHRGELSPEDLCWAEGMAEWQPLGTKFRPVVTHEPAAINPYAPPAANVIVSRQTPGLGEQPGFWMRVGAHIIDAILMNIIAAGFGFVLGLTMVAMQVKDTDMIEFAGGVIGLVVSWLYYALMESSAKQATLGKMALGIMVTDLNGGRISFGRATGRYFGQIVSALTLCIGFMMCGWTERKQCLHDMMAGCLLYRRN